MENDGDIKALFIVVNAGFAEEVIELARSEGLKGATILNARGEGVRHESFMGITINSEKELILSITKEHTAVKVMAVINEKVGIDSPAHSICFTMPVERTVGMSLI